MVDLVVAKPNPPADQNPAMVYIASLPSKHSRRAMEQSLRTIADLLQNGSDAFNFQWWSLRYQHTAALRSQIANTFGIAKANRMLSALRGVLKECWRLGYMNVEDYQRAIDVDNIKGETILAGREITDGEILALVNACNADKTLAGTRDLAILGILYTCGLRRSEIVALDVNDFDVTTGKLSIRKGKGRKQRTVYVEGGARVALDRWLASGHWFGALFVRVKKNGEPVMQRLTDQGIYHILQRRGKQANLSDFTPHDFRRTAAGALIERADIVTAQKILGHASVTTTGRYDRRPEETKRKAAQKIHFPI